MDIEFLKTFLEVHRSRHFGRAAECLFLTQSAVSARIRLLEDTLGASLFVRERKNLRLTEAGERLLAHAENIVAVWQRAERDVINVGGGRQPFAIAAPGILWEALLEDWLTQLAVARPDLSLHALRVEGEQLSGRLLDGRADLAFTLTARRGDAWLCREIDVLRLAPMTPQIGLDLEAALQHGYVVYSGDLGIRSGEERQRQVGVAPLARASSFRMAARLAAAGGAVAWLPEGFGARLGNERTLHRLRDAPADELPVYALYRPGATLPETLLDHWSATR